MSEYKGDGGGFDDGYKPKPFWPWVFLFIAMMLLPFCVRADTVTYQSQTLSGTAATTDGGTTQAVPINDVYTVTVTISGPLAPNLNMAMVVPQSWVVACQNCQVALSSSPPGLVNSPEIYVAATAAVFLFSTDATGKITAWNFAISGNSTVNTPSGATISQNSGSFVCGASGDTGISSQLSNEQVADAQLYTVTTTGPAGSWTQSSLAVTQTNESSTTAQKAAPQVRLWFKRL